VAMNLAPARPGASRPGANAAVRYPTPPLLAILPAPALKAPAPLRPLLHYTKHSPGVEVLPLPGATPGDPAPPQASAAPSGWADLPHHQEGAGAATLASFQAAAHDPTEKPHALASAALPPASSPPVPQAAYPADRALLRFRQASQPGVEPLRGPQDAPGAEALRETAPPPRRPVASRSGPPLAAGPPRDATARPSPAPRRLEAGAVPALRPPSTPLVVGERYPALSRNATASPPAAVGSPANARALRRVRPGYRHEVADATSSAPPPPALRRL
jgi:hypothetical protein